MRPEPAARVNCQARMLRMVRQHAVPSINDVPKFIEAAVPCSSTHACMRDCSCWACKQRSRLPGCRGSPSGCLPNYYKAGNSASAASCTQCKPGGVAPGDEDAVTCTCGATMGYSSAAYDATNGCSE